MKKALLMRRYSLLLFLFVIIASCKNKLSSQEIIDSLSKELCQCIEQAKFKNSSEIRPCYSKMFENNKTVIQEYYKTNNLSESQIDQLENKIAAKTVYNCEYIKNNFPSGFAGEERTKQLDVECEELKESTFYYLTQRPNSKIQDTTFVSISQGEYLEKMRGKTTYSRSKIIWEDNCKFNLIFENSDDPFKKEMFQKGQVFNYEVIANENDSFFLRLEWEGEIYQSQMFKLK